MSPPETAPASRRWHPWPVGIALAVLTAMALNLTMVFIARQNAPVMADKGDYYAHSLHWQSEIDAARASAALGLQAAVAAEVDALRLELRHPSGAPVTGWTGTLSAERGDAEAFDFEVPLVEGSPGAYRAVRPHRAAGLFRLRFRLSPPANAATGATDATVAAVPWVDERLLVLP